jgi:hypothetical protein
LSAWHAASSGCGWRYGGRCESILYSQEYMELTFYSPNTPSWHGAQLKHRNNFTLTFILHINSRGEARGIFHLCLKVKVMSLCLTKHHAMKTYWEVEVYAFLTLALDGDEWSASRPGRFTPRERAPGTHWIGGWVGPRAILDRVMRGKISWESKSRTPNHPARSPALYPLSYYSSVTGQHS